MRRNNAEQIGRLIREYHRLGAEALAAGASALAVERELPLPAPQIVVKDGRKAAGEIAAQVLKSSKT